MTAASYPSQAYFVVNDRNPLTDVWEAATGGFVPNTSAAYQSWVASGGVFILGQVQITNVQDNGSGAYRITVDHDTSLFTTNDVWVVQNTGTTADGTWPITVVSQFQLDLQGSVFGATATAGVIDRGEVIATFAALCTKIDNYNRTLYATGQFFGRNSTVASGTVNLPSPLLDIQLFTTPGAGGVCIAVLPKMNLFGSPPIGAITLFVNLSLDGSGHANAVQLRKQDGLTVIVTIAAPSQVNAAYNNAVLLEVVDNTTQNGDFTFQQISQVPLQTINGGVGTTTQPTAGQIPVGTGGVNSPYAPKSMSGDATNDANLVITLASVITAAGPVGDASHTWQLTYDAKGRLTAATNIAIAIADSAITYANESAHTVFAGPTSGGAAPPGFRALVAADIPQIPFTDISGTIASGQVSGSYTGITGVGTLTAGTWNGTKIGLAYGGTNADLSATGGANQFLKQSSAGAAITVGQPAFSDLSGSVAATQMPALTGDTTTTAGSVATTTKGINGVDQTTAYTAYTPTITASVGTFTTCTATGKSKQIGKTVHVQVVVTLTSIGTAAGHMIVTLPVNPVNAVSANVFGYTDVGGLGAFRACCGGVYDSGTKMSVTRYDGTFPGTSGDMIYLNFIYEAA